jgi:hypothetical protein
MLKITLTAEAARQLRESLSDFQVCDPDGNVLATVSRDMTPEFASELKRRAASTNVWRTSDQAEEMLAALEAARIEEGMLTKERKDRILAELRARWDGR